MQDKNYNSLKLIAFTIVFLITCALSLQAKTKSAQENEKKDKKKTNEELIFDSCDKNDVNKCEKDKQISTPNYSKSLK